MQRLAQPAPAAARGLSDGGRLPGREGPPRDAAVLVPLVHRADGLTLLLTQRSADLPDHPGQIALPGGRVEPATRTGQRPHCARPPKKRACPRIV